MKAGYTYTGLKTWTGRITADGAALDTPDDFWNEHQFYYECMFDDEWWAFKPDLQGWSDGRCMVEIYTPQHDSPVEMYFDKTQEMWIERVPGKGNLEHFCLSSYEIPYQLQPLLDAAARRAYGYDEKVEAAI